MNSFELIEKYAPQSVDKYFAEDSKTAILEKGAKFIDVSFKETGYVKIATILMDGLSDYYQTQTNSVDYVNPALERPDDPANYAAYAGNLAEGQRDGFGIGGVDLQWEIFRLQWVRSKQFRIDHIANEETAGVVMGNLFEEFNRTKVIPEVDAARFSFIADQASVSLGNLATETINANEIISKFNSAFEWQSEHEVSEEDQIIFVSPAVMTLILNTTELEKRITQDDYKSESGITFAVKKYMGRPIIEVPSNRFFTNILLTKNNGYRVTTSSKVINYMIVSTKAVVPIRKIEWTKTYDENLTGLAGYYGYMLNYLLYHGIFVPKNKVPGVYVSVSNVDAKNKVNTLSVDTVEGTAQYSWKVRRHFTNPAGLRGTLYKSATELTLGANVLSTAATMVVEGVENTESAGNKKYYFGLVDAAGTIIAVTGQVTVAQKA